MNKMGKNLCRTLVFTALFLGSISPALADILITPTRVVFEGRDRFATVTVANSGNEPAIYQMGWKYFEMQEEGTAYEPIEGAVTDLDIADYVVFSPRRVTLAPGAKQKVRLALRRPAEVEDGDYRAHLWFSVLPETADELSVKEKTVSVKINVGYTIPVVWRAGEVTSTAQIGDITLKRNEKNGLLRVHTPILRSGGPYSVLGHLIVYHIDQNGNQERVGEVSNAHVFPEVDRRVFDVQLIKDITGGSLRVVLYDYNFDRSKSDNVIFADRTFDLN